MTVKCQVCGGTDLFEFLDLGHHPPSDAFLAPEDMEKEERTYPLRLYHCNECNLVQIGYALDPSLIFGEKYVYMSGTNESLRNHLNSIPGYLVEKFGLGPRDLVVDIGANDGTLLEGFRHFGVRALGVEPSRAGVVMEQKGIQTVRNFFGQELADEILQQHGKAKIITATNVFAHVRDIQSLMNGVRRLLSDDGVFLTESHYLVDMVNGLQYVEVYLEHLRYYSIASLTSLFDLFDMVPFHAERVPTHGGSIRVLSCKKGMYAKSDMLQMLIEQENHLQINSRDTLLKFGRDVSRNRRDLMQLLWGIKSEGNRIAGVAAPAKGSTLLNYCRIGPELIDYAVDNNPLKVGKYTPGTHIRIVDESRLLADQPEYVLLLSWDIKDFLVPKLRKGGYKGRFVVPIPSPTIC